MADDAELSSIRAKRMQELQDMQMFGIGNSSQIPWNQQQVQQPQPQPQPQQQQGQQQSQQHQGQQQNQEEMAAQQNLRINSVLNQVLDQQARARLNTIMVAKPEKGKQVEQYILQMATSGQIGGRLSEHDLIGLVERVNARIQKTTTVKFDRRRAALDSDDDDW